EHELRREVARLLREDHFPSSVDRERPRMVELTCRRFGRQMELPRIPRLGEGDDEARSGRGQLGSACARNDDARRRATAVYLAHADAGSTRESARNGEPARLRREDGAEGG